MKSEFLALDADGDGDISVAELETLIKSVKRQLKMSDKEISKLIKDVDQNGDGKVDCNEFFHLIQSGKNRDVLHKELIKRSGIRQTFKKYDADGNGVITRDEFRKIVSDKYQTKYNYETTEHPQMSTCFYSKKKFHYLPFICFHFINLAT